MNAVPNKNKGLTPSQLHAKQRGARIKQEMKRLGLRQEDLAKRASISQTMVSKLIRGIPQKTKELPAIAAALGVSLDWLETGKGKKEIVPAHNDARFVDEHTENTVDLFELCQDGAAVGTHKIALPRIGGNNTHNGKEGMKLVFTKTTLQQYGVQPENALHMIMEGNANEPVIPNGTVIGIDTGRTDIVDGNLYAIQQLGRLRVKAVYVTATGGLRLRSFNTDEYPDEYYEPEQLHSLRIVGRVFWYSVFIK